MEAHDNLDKIATSRPFTTPQKFHEAYQELGAVARGRQNSNGKTAASIAQERLLGMLERMPPSFITGGDPRAGALLLQQANQNWAAAKRAENVSGRIVKAEQVASGQYSGLGLENELRRRMGVLGLPPEAAGNRPPSRGFTEDERRSSKIRQGTTKVRRYGRCARRSRWHRCPRRVLGGGALGYFGGDPVYRCCWCWSAWRDWLRHGQPQRAQPRTRSGAHAAAALGAGNAPRPHPTAAVGSSPAVNAGTAGTDARHHRTIAREDSSKSVSGGIGFQKGDLRTSRSVYHSYKIADRRIPFQLSCVCVHLIVAVGPWGPDCGLSGRRGPSVRLRADSPKFPACCCWLELRAGPATPFRPDQQFQRAILARGEGNSTWPHTHHDGSLRARKGARNGQRLIKPSVVGAESD